jgi:DNA end-binding protein Ku
MARALWSGSISFGLVNIPVQVYEATKDKDIHFHQLCKKDNSRIRQKLVCEADRQEVSRDEIVKGYEISPDHYVVFDNDEIRKLQPEKNPNIEIVNFVDLADIDPLYFERPYYLLPKPGAAKPYKLLLEAMKDSKRIGIGRFVIHGKEYLGAIRCVDGVICLETMRFADEVITVDQLDTGPEERTKLNKSELSTAKQLVDALAAKFKPEQYKNEYRQRVRAAIEAKAQGHKIVAPEAKPEAKVADLMSALKKSIERAKHIPAKKRA